MKAYTVHRFYVCQLSGQVLAEVSFSVENELRCVHHTFASVELANAYFNKEKRDWLLGTVEAFIMHKKHIIDATGSDDQKKALAICLNALDHYHKVSTEKACTGILNGFKYFEAILPNPQNPSHKSSVENLSEIKLFCETHLKTNA